VLPSEEEEISLAHSERVIGRIDRLVLAVGALRVECAALVVGECHSGYGNLGTLGTQHSSSRIELLPFKSYSVRFLSGSYLARQPSGKDGSDCINTDVPVFQKTVRNPSPLACRH